MKNNLQNITDKNRLEMILSSLEAKHNAIIDYTKQKAEVMNRIILIKKELNNIK